MNKCEICGKPSKYTTARLHPKPPGSFPSPDNALGYPYDYELVPVCSQDCADKVQDAI
jgi:hypothetical protein